MHFRSILLQKSKRLQSTHAPGKHSSTLVYSAMLISFVLFLYYIVKHSVTFSIIIPLYNAEDYLDDCLLSVLNQSYQDFEAIIIDDASSDRSFFIAEQYRRKDKRIKLIHYSINKGTLLARKAGIMMAKGKFLLFLDPDDYLSTDMLTILINKMQERDVDILQFNATCFNGTEKWIQDVKTFLNPKSEALIESSEAIVTQCFVKHHHTWSLCTKVFNRKLVQQAMNLVESHHIIAAEDAYLYMIIISLSTSYRSTFTPPLYHYRLRSRRSTDSTIRPKIIMDELTILKMMKQFTATYPNLPAFTKAQISWQNLMLNEHVYRFTKIPADSLCTVLATMLHVYGRETLMPKLIETFNSTRQDLIQQMEQCVFLK